MANYPPIKVSFSVDNSLPNTALLYRRKEFSVYDPMCRGTGDFELRWVPFRECWKMCLLTYPLTLFWALSDCTDVHPYARLPAAELGTHPSSLTGCQSRRKICFRFCRPPCRAGLSVWRCPPLPLFSTPLHGAESFFTSRQFSSYSIISQHFMVPEGREACTQQFSNNPYPEPDQSSHYEPILSLYDQF
jgi:hypothetical protein